MKNQKENSLVIMVALALGIACMQLAPAQTFKQVTVNGKAPLVQVASGGASVWALASNGKPYIFNGETFVLANNISLTQIAVGGGSAAQADEVWGLNSSGSIYRASKSGGSWVFSQVPGVLDFIAVGIGYQDNCHPYEIWGLNPAASIYRYSFCSKNWDQVPGTLQTLAVGGGDIWGVNGGDSLFRFDFKLLGFDQVLIINNNPVSQIAVSPTDIWTVTGGSVFDALFLYGGPVDAPEVMTQIQAGGNGLWGIGLSKALYRLDPSVYAFIQIPGALASISVGSGGGVWGINQSGKPYVFTTP
jgi:hypothetical protein